MKNSEIIPIIIIVIAENEEPNIESCLSSVVGWAKQVFVVDGFSADRTVELARECGAEVVQHKFVDWASQRNWALQNLPIETEWIFFLDADEEVTIVFKSALEQHLSSSPDDLAGIYVRFAFWFLGKELRFAYEAPPIMRVVRRGHARWINEGAREYCEIDGRTALIKERLVHRDRKGLHGWIEKQNRNATREASLAFKGQNKNASERERGNLERPMRTWIRRRLYPNLPGWLRPFAHFTYRYFFRMGFLDGYAGFTFCFLHAFWLPCLIEAKIYEKKQPI
jgi:glycosyltransferase involved in cell wall biosynthesis